MKYKFFILLIFFTNYMLGQESLTNKNVKVIYTHSLMKGIFLNDYSLIVNDSIGQFTSNREKQKKENNGTTFEIKADKYTNNYNFNTKTYQEHRELENNIIIASEWKSDLIWEITNETKIIMGYKVIKAKTESYELKKDNPYYQGKAIAWFTTDIPISIGPARYCGLPGLILEIEYEKGNSKYTFKSIDFKSVENIKDIKDGKKVGKTDILYWR